MLLTRNDVLQSALGEYGRIVAAAAIVVAIAILLFTLYNENALQP